MFYSIVLILIIIGIFIILKPELIKTKTSAPTFTNLEGINTGIVKGNYALQFIDNGKEIMHINANNELYILNLEGKMDFVGIIDIQNEKYKP